MISIVKLLSTISPSTYHDPLEEVMKMCKVLSYYNIQMSSAEGRCLINQIANRT